MFGEEYHRYQARNDNDPTQGNLIKLNLGKETKK